MMMMVLLLLLLIIMIIVPFVASICLADLFTYLNLFLLQKISNIDKSREHHVMNSHVPINQLDRDQILAVNLVSSIFFSLSSPTPPAHMIVFSNNSRTIQFTYLKCTTRWFFVNSWSCATITTISFRTFHHPQKKPHALQVSPPVSASQTPSPKQPLICFLFL